MKRPSREINIISISALDLFASAMGAFMVLTIILSPYYRRPKPEPRPPAELGLLGIISDAKTMVFLVDLSGSMEENIKLIRDTMARMVAPMEPDRQVQLIGFHGPFPPDNNNIRLPEWQSPRTLAPMSAENKKALVATIFQWTKTVKGGTPTREALLEALEYPCEAIFLFSDGVPNISGTGDSARLQAQEAIRQAITSQNAGRKKIHCVALPSSYTTSSDIQAFLAPLARENGGQFLALTRE